MALHAAGSKTELHSSRIISIVKAEPRAPTLLLYGTPSKEVVRDGLLAQDGA